MFKLILSLTLLGYVACFLPAQPPRWEPRYDLLGSTLSMVANRSGYFDNEIFGKFSVVSIDWSNGKNVWVQATPMNCSESMIQQAKILKENSNINIHVFGYANLVKALPWFTPIREKLLDPNYEGFFLKFDKSATPHVPPCTEGQGCSDYYHDQEQTPGYPSGDGSCINNCDCGLNIPCGEYLFDHRNGSMLRDFILNEYLYSPLLLGSNNIIDGLFIDDFWCSISLNSTCNDPAVGPSEVDKYSAIDMGLDDTQITLITNEWLITMTEVQKKIIQNNHYTWSLLPGQANANASPLMINNNTCLSTLRQACNPNNMYKDLPLLSGVDPDMKSLYQQTAAFLLMRGDYAWIGWGQWGMEWPGDESVPFPSMWLNDELNVNQKFVDPYCEESSEKPGVFSRQIYDQLNVQLDCNTWTTNLQNHQKQIQN